MEQAVNVIAERFEIIDRHLEAMFCEVLRESEGDPPRLSQVLIEIVHCARQVRITARFGDRPRLRFQRRTVELCEELSGLRDGLYDAGTLWSRMYEDHYVECVLRAGEEQFGAAVVDRDGYEERRRALEEFRRIACINHDLLARDRPSTALEIGQRVQEPARQLADLMNERIFAALGEVHLSQQRVGAGRGETLTVERLREARRQLAGNDRRLREEDDGDYGWARITAYYGARLLALDVGDGKAQQRGLELLKANLTEAQRRQYDECRHFDVKGGQTGRTYRIHHGRQMNIEQLDKEGQRVCGWCFRPEGGLVAGDVMLAQKTALDLYEREALKVANRF